MILDDDRQLRHQMMEGHADWRAAGNHIPLHGAQQIGRPASVALIKSHGKTSRRSRFGIGIVGRECRRPFRCIVPGQFRSQEYGTVIIHRVICDIIARRARNGQTDPVTLVEIETRNTGKSRYDPYGRKGSSSVIGTSDRRDYAHGKQRQ